MDGSTKVLADFVSQTKNRYLQDVKDGKGGDWTVAMGNEAGGERSVNALRSNLS